MNLRGVRGQGKFPFPCSVDHKQDWQPYPVDPYSAESADMYTHMYITAHSGPVILVLPRYYTCGGYGGVYA